MVENAIDYVLFSDSRAAKRLDMHSRLYALRTTSINSMRCDLK